MNSDRKVAGSPGFGAAQSVEAGRKTLHKATESRKRGIHFEEAAEVRQTAEQNAGRTRSCFIGVKVARCWACVNYIYDLINFREDED